MARRQQVHIAGFQKVMKNLNHEIEEIKGRTLGGVIEGAAVVRRHTEKTPPVTPVDWGNLRNSWFTVASRSGGEVSGQHASFRGPNATRLESQHSRVISEEGAEAGSSREPLVVFGFSADYAVPVHEMVGADFKRAGSGAKFFAQSIYVSVDEILTVIAKRASIK